MHLVTAKSGLAGLLPVLTSNLHTNVAVIYSNDFIKASQAGPYHDILICKGAHYSEASA